jgi:hypothetical protein
MRTKMLPTLNKAKISTGNIKLQLGDGHADGRSNKLPL